MFKIKFIDHSEFPGQQEHVEYIEGDSKRGLENLLIRLFPHIWEQIDMESIEFLNGSWEFGGEIGFGDKFPLTIYLQKIPVIQRKFEGIINSHNLEDHKEYYKNQKINQSMKKFVDNFTS